MRLTGGSGKILKGDAKFKGKEVVLGAGTKKNVKILKPSNRGPGFSLNK